MIKIKQSRKLRSGCRTLSIIDNKNNVGHTTDVLRLVTEDGNTICLDISKDGTIHVWTNGIPFKVDTEI